MMDESAKNRLLKLVRDALNHLQDPGFLRHSPLATLLNVADRPDTPSALQQLLVEAITALEPEAGQPSDSRAWRVYESVFYRYVEGFDQEEVAGQLGLSVRQLRREQRDAFEAIAFELWKRFDLEPALTADEAAAASAQDRAERFMPDGDLEWLKETTPEAAADLGVVLPAVMRLLQPLSTQHAVLLDFAVEDGLPPLGMDAVAARQALLSLLSVAIRRASPDSRVNVSAGYLDQNIQVQIRCEVVGDAKQGPFSDEEQASLEVARKVANLYNGYSTASAANGAFEAWFVLPCITQRLILAIDDNAEMLQLLQRYAAGTHYRLIGLRDPEQAVSQATRLAPQAILLDVMMPRVDGWEIMERLRAHPETRDIPILVCTILPQEELAMSLGASGFLRKPIMRDDFLAALHRHAAPMGKAPR